MSFCRLNNIVLPVKHDTWEEISEDIGDEPKRTITGAMAATRTGKLRKWRFTTPPLPPTTVGDGSGLNGRNVGWRVYEKLIEAFGANWQFEAYEAISGQGFTDSVAGTFALTASSPPVGANVLRVTSGSVFGAQMKYRMGVQRAGGWNPSSDGYTFGFRRLFVAGETYTGWRQCLLIGTADFVRGASANPSSVNQYVDGGADNTANLGRVCSVSLTSPYVGLHAYKTTNSAANVDYKDAFFLPYRIPAAWVPDLFTYFDEPQMWTDMPKMTMTGDCLTATSDTVSASVIGRVRRGKQMFANGSNNHRELEVELFETL